MENQEEIKTTPPVIEDPRMLVLRFSALGDVAMTIPVVYSLARQYPKLKIDYATSSQAARLFIDPPSNLKVIPFDLHGIYSGPIGAVKLFKKLSELKPNLIADLHNVGRTWALDSMFKATGAKLAIVDKMRSSRRQVISGKTSHPSFIERYADVFKSLGYPVNINFKSVFSHGTPAPPFEIQHPAVGIAPFARYAGKTYPLHLMSDVARRLAANGMNVYLFGAAGEEEEKLESLAHTIDGCESLAGKFNLDRELVIMANLDLMITMDSANHHLASLVGTPVLSIWGGTTPACGFMAYNQPQENALHSDLGCQPCSIAGSNKCARGDFGCLIRLSPEKICEKALSLIRK